jgi:RNA polymerase sigma-70 factor (ECF subfamily)
MAQPKKPGEASAREVQWAEWMRAGLSGDGGAYRHLLEALVPFLRRLAQQGLMRAGAGNADAEDVVQEILLAIHLKRHTWMTDQPLSPWLNAIARYKLIDALRRRGRRGEVPIDDLIEVLPDRDTPAEASPRELEKLVGRLKGREHDVVTAISLEGGSVRDAAKKLSMSDGAVRVALHRGLKRLAQLSRSEEVQ